MPCHFDVWPSAPQVRYLLVARIEVMQPMPSVDLIVTDPPYPVR